MFPANSRFRVVLVLTIVIGQFVLAQTGSGAELGQYPQLRGFPVKAQGFVKTTPVVADIDGDGHNELLVASYGGKVQVWNAAGRMKSGYPVSLGGVIMAHPALADLNGDGDLEIAIAASTDKAGVPGRVFILQPDGSNFPGWPKTVDRYGSVKPSKIVSVVLADVDGDSVSEVIVGTNNNILGTSAPPGTKVPNLYVWRYTGESLGGNWPAKDSPAVLGTIAVGDLNSDGYADVVTGRDYQWLFAYDRFGNDLPGWPVETLLPARGDPDRDPRIVHKVAMPTLADLDHDGEMDFIVVGERKLPGSGDDVNMDLLVLRPDGTRRRGWETTAPGVGLLAPELEMFPGPVVADLNGDDHLDIVTPMQDGWMRAYSDDKTLLWQFNYAGGKVIHASEPVIGDVDGDGLNEIVFGTYDPYGGTVGPVGLYILENNGTPKSGMPLATEAPGLYAAPALADLDKDGKLDIIASSRFGTVYAWATGAAYDPRRLPWPTARQNIQRAAFVDPIAMRPSLSGSSILPNTGYADQGQDIRYTIRLVRTGYPLTDTVHLNDVIPNGLTYVPGSLTATSGSVDAGLVPTLSWTGQLSDTAQVEIGFSVSVIEPFTAVIVNSVEIDGGSAGQLNRSATVLVNGVETYLPIIRKSQ